MCNRAERGQTDKVLRLFGARLGAAFNDGPLVVHPKEPGSVLRLVDGQLVLEQMTWGFPVALASKRDPKVKNKPKPAASGSAGPKIPCNAASSPPSAMPRRLASAAA